MTSDFSNITSDQPLVLVGGGRMGSALLSGWLAAGVEPAAVSVIEPFAETRQQLAEACPGVSLVEDAGAVQGQPSVVVLAVKPQVMGDVVSGLPNWQGALFISIAAGKTISFFEDHLGADASIIRVMPNTPAAVGAGMSVAVGNGNVSKDAQELATALLQATGMVDWVDDEALIDAVTAVSGSGPAYVFHLVEAMAAAGVRAGLTPELAEKLARQTVIGSGVLMREDTSDAATLRQNVTSPGGTTQAALDVLMDNGVMVDLMVRAIAAARKRSEELSG